MLGVGLYYLMDLAEQAVWDTDALNTKPATVIGISGVIALFITVSGNGSGTRESGSAKN